MQFLLLQLQNTRCVDNTFRIAAQNKHTRISIWNIFEWDLQMVEKLHSVRNGVDVNDRVGYAILLSRIICTRNGQQLSHFYSRPLESGANEIWIVCAQMHNVAIWNNQSVNRCASIIKSKFSWECTLYMHGYRMAVSILLEIPKCFKDVDTAVPVSMASVRIVWCSVMLDFLYIESIVTNQCHSNGMSI